MDFFRFDENGKIVEHWDAIQQIPKESKNPIPCTNNLIGFFWLAVI